MRIMYDSVTAADIPAEATLILAYIDGTYAWSVSDFQLHAAADVVTIVVNPTNDDGDVLDVESGDADPSDCPQWVYMRQQAGLLKPMLYCSLSRMGDVQSVMENQQLDYQLFIADWTGSPHLVPGSYATQYASPDTGSGGHYDLSLVYDFPERGIFGAWQARAAGRRPGRRA